MANPLVMPAIGNCPVHDTGVTIVATYHPTADGRYKLSETHCRPNEGPLEQEDFACENPENCPIRLRLPEFTD